MRSCWPGWRPPPRAAESFWQMGLRGATSPGHWPVCDGWDHTEAPGDYLQNSARWRKCSAEVQKRDKKQNKDAKGKTFHAALSATYSIQTHEWKPRVQPGMYRHCVSQRVPLFHFPLQARQDKLLQHVVENPARYHGLPCIQYFNERVTLSCWPPPGENNTDTTCSLGCELHWNIPVMPTPALHVFWDNKNFFRNSSARSLPTQLQCVCEASRSPRSVSDRHPAQHLSVCCCPPIASSTSAMSQSHSMAVSVGPSQQTASSSVGRLGPLPVPTTRIACTPHSNPLVLFSTYRHSPLGSRGWRHQVYFSLHSWKENGVRLHAMGQIQGMAT